MNHLENEGEEAITQSSNTQYNWFHFMYLLPGLAPMHMWFPLAAMISVFSNLLLPRFTLQHKHVSLFLLSSQFFLFND